MDQVELEQKRRYALMRFGLLDTAPEKVFDGITLAIANICEVPIALISLVDADRQWFKSAFGLNVRETPREVAFCSHAITRPDELMVVEDAVADPRFETNPLVTGEPNIRFYAGKPIVTDDGYAIGTLCVIDRESRQLSPHQAEALNALSHTVAAILEERYRVQRLAIDRDGVEEALSQLADYYQHLYGDGDSLLRGLLDRLGTAAIVLNEKATIVSFNRSWQEFSTMLGWRPAKVGESYLEFKEQFGLSTTDHASIDAGLKDVLDGGVAHFELAMPGASRPWAVQAQAMQGGVLLQHSLLTHRSSNPRRSP